MNLLLPSLIATAASAALTWFFCLRPMLRKDRASGAGCFATQGRDLDAEIRAARDEVEQVHTSAPGDRGSGPHHAA